MLQDYVEKSQESQKKKAQFPIVTCDVSAQVAPDSLSSWKLLELFCMISSPTQGLLLYKYVYFGLQIEFVEKIDAIRLQTEHRVFYRSQ